MANPRTYILDRISSKKTSIEEFNYDALQAPPISMFLSYADIAQLRYIATSIKLSAKANVRYEMVHDLMKRRGMIKVGAGTNRVVYAHPDYPDIVFKIATDDVGMHDNPAEFRNQFILKPFCAKTFEVTPCGTVAISERVQPITSREEYLSVASDIFTLINEWMIGEYVIADFGSKFFMNFAHRKNGFGVVMCDYTYIYKLDGNKLFCSKPDPTQPSGRCEGVIDYDAGYNELICTKCGAKYKAKELEKKILDKELIIEREDEINMEFVRKGGSLNLNNEVSNTNKPSEVLGEAKSYIPNAERKPERQVHSRRSIDFSTIPIGKDAEKTPGMEAVRNTAVVEAPVVEEKVVPKKEELVVNGVATEPVVETKNDTPKRSMVTFSEDIKREAIEEAAAKPEEEKTPVRVIEDAARDIIKALDEIGIDIVKTTAVQNAISSILGALRTEDANKIVLSELDDRIGTMDSDATQDLLNMIAEIVNVSVKTTNAVREGNDYIIDYCASINTEIASENTSVVADSKFLGSFIISDVFEESKPAYPVSEQSVEEAPIEETTNTEESSKSIKSMRMYDAKIINIKELFPKEQPTNAIVIYDEDGNILTLDGEIIAIDTLNDKSMNAITVVSKAWFDGLNNDEDVDGVETLKAAGMSVDEFIKAEEAAKEEE